MVQSDENLFFVGAMGSGKTTIGRRVARHLGRPFIDCDEELERRTGADATLIFDIEGEAGFRKREHQLLTELSELRGAVIATGGGIVVNPENRALIKRAGHVVWLKTSVPQQLERLRRDKKRPLLATPDRTERLQALARARDPLYAEIADIVVLSENRSLRYMTKRTLEAIEAFLTVEEA